MWPDRGCCRPGVRFAHTRTQGRVRASLRTCWTYGDIDAKVGSVVQLEVEGPGVEHGGSCDPRQPGILRQAVSAHRTLSWRWTPIVHGGALLPLRSHQAGRGVPSSGKITEWAQLRMQGGPRSAPNSTNAIRLRRASRDTSGLSLPMRRRSSSCREDPLAIPAHPKRLASR
jgi:hypothetical protein